MCGSFEEDNIDTIEVVSKTTGDTQVDSVTAQIRDGLFIARALNFYDGSNLATKATATATDLAENTVNTTNTGIDLDTSIDVWYEYDAAGRREYKYEAGEYDNGDPFTHYYWNDAGYLKQVDIDYGENAPSPRCARAWLTWDPTGELVKLEIRAGSSLGSLSPGSGGTLVLFNKYTYFLGSVIVEREEVGDPSEKEYVAVAGEYLYQKDASGDYWYYHHDDRGSVAAITDASRNIKGLYEYDSFGNKLTNAGTVDNPFGFYGGTLLDRVALIHRGGPRLYEPETGLHLSQRNRTGGDEDNIVPVAAFAVLAIVALAIGLPSNRHRAVAVVIAIFLAVVATGSGCRKEDEDDTPEGYHYSYWSSRTLFYEAQLVDIGVKVVSRSGDEMKCPLVYVCQCRWTFGKAHFRTLRKDQSDEDLETGTCGETETIETELFPDQVIMRHVFGKKYVALNANAAKDCWDRCKKFVEDKVTTGSPMRATSGLFYLPNNDRRFKVKTCDEDYYYDDTRREEMTR